mmetsp:Transcript_16052/g.27601  ORF Transcript_16052/g.27601 Transcript_16052/m.27601 type:complete len:278 (-) Transcript_16052:505-1338(-)
MKERCATTSNQQNAQPGTLSGCRACNATAMVRRYLSPCGSKASAPLLVEALPPGSSAITPTISRMCGRPLKAGPRSSASRFTHPTNTPRARPRKASPAPCTVTATSSRAKPSTAKYSSGASMTRAFTTAASAWLCACTTAMSMKQRSMRSSSTSSLNMPVFLSAFKQPSTPARSASLTPCAEGLTAKEAAPGCPVTSRNHCSNSWCTCSRMSGGSSLSLRTATAISAPGRVATSATCPMRLTCSTSASCTSIAGPPPPACAAVASLCSVSRLDAKFS